MSQKDKAHGAMLEMWRPPQDAGDPIGCLATTFTFSPGLFDEQCLARFLEIDSQPNREDLAFLLERESRLGGVYAGVLVDQINAGVEHSLRWDILPVRIPVGIQHAKLSLLAWSRHVRLIVSSANLTEPGYRTNFEVCGAVEMTPRETDHAFLSDAAAFYRRLLSLVPGASDRTPETERAESFLAQVENHVRKWESPGRGSPVKQHLVWTMPEMGSDSVARSSLEEAIHHCRKSPDEVWVASPFFDKDDSALKLTAQLCKLMARGSDSGRRICFCLPVARSEEGTEAFRLAAPKAIYSTPEKYQAKVSIEMLPAIDEDKNPRPWHAKMVALLGESYSALMAGSSNFTCAGMGIGQRRNAEANLLTIVQYEDHGRLTGQLEAMWLKMEKVPNPEEAEWLGGRPEEEEAEGTIPQRLHRAFLSATYRSGDDRRIILRLNPEETPDAWEILSCGRDVIGLFNGSRWIEMGRPSEVTSPWEPAQPPDKLLVKWDGLEAFLPINVEDSRLLPPPERLEKMSADDMLFILAASDPSAAFRAWAKNQRPSDVFDEELDSATAPDLDPLRRYDLGTTFLHRVRRRARILAQLRANLQRPVWSRQALQWRLRGLIGVEALANRLVKEFEIARDAPGEFLLTLADFLMVLREVDYQTEEGALQKDDFESVYRPFLKGLSASLNAKVGGCTDGLAEDLLGFWNRVVEQCRK